nr:uncharacterized protein LOC107439455 isoform X1 [Parasteatoda tepidariorum]XP_042901107.1 uncharacterized protein LOC107439455 isoform X1 [Parasteatoda tepidariorum]XP_042901108.1 uncharacterized protein LOC107439455 isoform X1 [Parasteatoda tepidariorum]XP_042901109.1 uncharacterized protein LOC107439455 isoform X1 [Parasteatoda tepidariorum]
MLIWIKSVTAVLLLFNLITLSRSSNQIPNVSTVVDTNSDSAALPFGKDEKTDSRNNETIVNTTAEHLVSKILVREANGSSAIEPSDESKRNLTVANGKLIEPNGFTNGAQKANNSSVIARNAESQDNVNVSYKNLAERKNINNRTHEVNDGQVVEHNVERKGLMEPKAISNSSRKTHDSGFVENSAESKRNVTMVTGSVIEPKISTNVAPAEKSELENKKDEELQNDQKRENASANKENKELDDGQKREGISANKEDKVLHNRQKMESTSSNEENRELHSRQKIESASSNKDDKELHNSQKREGISANKEVHDGHKRENAFANNENKELHHRHKIEGASESKDDKELLHNSQKIEGASSNTEDKELHSRQKIEGASPNKKDKEFREELSTAISSKVINHTNDNDNRAEINSKEFDGDKELSVPILPPLPIMFRAFVPLVIPPLQRISVQPVPPPAIHISDRLPIYDAETSEDSSTAEDSPQRIQSAMRSLISDVLGSISRINLPLHPNSSKAAGNSSVDTESGEDSKLVDLQGQQFLMKSKMTHLNGRNGRFFLRFMSLRPLEGDVLSDIEEPQNIKEKHDHEGVMTDEIQKETIGSKIEIASKENSSLDTRNLHELGNKNDTGTSVSDAEKGDDSAGKEFGGNLKDMSVGILDARTRENLKTSNSASHSAGSEDESEITNKNTAGGREKSAEDHQLHAEESQLTLIQNYRSFPDPVLPVYKNTNSKDGVSEIRLRDVPLEGDVSVSPFVAKALPSIASVKEVSPSDTNVEKVVALTSNATNLTTFFSDVEKNLQMDANIKQVPSAAGSVEKVLPLVDNAEIEPFSIGSVKKVTPLASSVEKGSTMFASVEKDPSMIANDKNAPLAVSNESKVMAKGDDQPYEEEGSYPPKSIILESRSLLSKKSNATGSSVDLKADTKDNVSKHSEYKTSATGGQISNDSNESSIKESGQKPLLLNGGEKISEVSFKGKVDKLHKQKNPSQGNNTENTKLTTASGLKGDILFEKR